MMTELFEVDGGTKWFGERFEFECPSVEHDYGAEIMVTSGTGNDIERPSPPQCPKCRLSMVLGYQSDIFDADKHMAWLAERAEVEGDYV